MGPSFDDTGLSLIVALSKPRLSKLENRIRGAWTDARIEDFLRLSVLCFRNANGRNTRANMILIYLGPSAAQVKSSGDWWSLDLELR